MTTSSDFSDPEDNIIELTQNNTEQRTELISNSYIQNSPGTIRCYLCSLDITQLSIFEREVHVNSCLDKPSIPIEFHCPSCGRDLTHFNEHRRTAHVNLCLDRSITTDHAFEIENIPPRQSHYEETKPRENEPDDNVEAESEEYLCKICGINLSDQQLIMRIRHVKRCGKQFGIRPQEIQHEIQLHDAKHNDLGDTIVKSFF
jgi:transposase-like protein